MAHAITGQMEELIRQDRITPGLAADYLKWAGRFVPDVRETGFIDTDIFHLYHGDLALRKYSERMMILREHNYDPARDIALEPGGCWRWNSDKPEMHRRIREYFQERDEDGRKARDNPPEPMISGAA
jgi:hypothetical protein